jgi:hypothetical protein
MQKPSLELNPWTRIQLNLTGESLLVCRNVAGTRLEKGCISKLAINIFDLCREYQRNENRVNRCSNGISQVSPLSQSSPPYRTKI